MNYPINYYISNESPNQPKSQQKKIKFSNLCAQIFPSRKESLFLCLITLQVKTNIQKAEKLHDKYASYSTQHKTITIGSCFAT